MKKVVFLWTIFFTIFSYTSADENLIEFENIGFRWQLFINQNNNPNIDFIALNPMFFDNDNDNGNDYFLINFLENISQNNRSQNTQRINTNSQGKNFNIFSTIIFLAGTIYANSFMNRQEREVYNNRWTQQIDEERTYRRIFLYK